MCILLLSELWEKEWAHINSLHLLQHITSIVDLPKKSGKRPLYSLTMLRFSKGKQSDFQKGWLFPLSEWLLDKLEFSIHFLNIPIS